MRWAFFSAIAALLTLSGCATGSGKPAGAVAEPVRITLLGKEQISAKYGMTKAANPYLEPKSIIGQPYDFIVLEMATDFPAPTKLELEVTATGPSGAQVATLWRQDDFRTMWEGFLDNEVSMLRREQTINDFSVPGERMTAARGRNTYVIALVGMHTLPKPVAVKVRVLYGLEAYEFETSVK